MIEPMSDKQFEYYQNLLRHKAFSMIEYRLFCEVERLRGVVPCKDDIVEALQQAERKGRDAAAGEER